MQLKIIKIIKILGFSSRVIAYLLIMFTLQVISNVKTAY